MTGRRGERTNAADFSIAADDVFGRIASRYGVLCDLFSCGIHRIWKNRVAELIAREPCARLLDVATGTGDIAIRFLKRQRAGVERTVIAADNCPQMLAIAQRRLGKGGMQVDLRLLDAHSMPSIPDASIDLYSISLALKICNRMAVLREALRVLRPGGRLIILEASTIPWPWLRLAYLGYMATCMPIIGWVATGGDASAYRYLLAGIHGFPGAEELAAELEDLGFREVTFERLSLGIVAIHTARK